ncbi:M12 family metallopeptidase [Fibrella arboris]|uniref:M12 family metallopeptidase n=1 Tax=Fibrella arboris TaxID=3242486 RepID=UPI003521AB77
MGHTVGLYHEQSRADRDNAVTVLTQNIQPGYETDFQTYGQQNKDGFDQPGGFDFNSVMLYHSWSFSVNGQPTLVKKDGSTFDVNRTALSPLDIATVQTMSSRPPLKGYARIATYVSQRRSSRSYRLSQ